MGWWLRHRLADQVQTRLCFSHASPPIRPGSAAAFSSAFARNNGSRLLSLRLHFTHSPAVSFLTSPAYGRFSRTLPRSRALPGPSALFVSPFGVFGLLADSPLSSGNRQSHPTVLIHSSNHLPSGNCDSPRPETSRNYLTRFGTVSLSSLTAQSLLRVTDPARTESEELVNPASFHPHLSKRISRGTAPTSLAQSFPSRLGLSLRHPTATC